MVVEKTTGKRDVPTTPGKGEDENESDMREDVQIQSQEEKLLRKQCGSLRECTKGVQLFSNDSVGNYGSGPSVV